MFKIKVLIKYIFLTALALSVWILANSIDDSPYDDLGILGKLKQVAKDENGYEVIHYLNDQDNEIFSQNDIFTRLNSHIDGSEWDQEFVDQVLKEYSSIISDVETAIQRPYFKFPEHDSLGSTPSYIRIINASRLLILNSKNEANSLNSDAAIALLRSALKFGQLIKTEENATLISHMIGLTMQQEQMAWLHHFLQDDELDIEQLDMLQAAMDIVPGYQDDGFKKVFYGEYKFKAVIAEGTMGKSLSQRLDDYRSLESSWYSFAEEREDDYWGVSPKSIRFMRAVIPDYYFHPNDFLTKTAPINIDLAEQTPKYCNEINYTGNTWNPSWLDIIMPNSSTKQSLASGTENYRMYFSRRCLSHVYTDALKTLFAIRRYEIVNGKLPDSLEILVPEFLDHLPVDYFDGSTLKYSPENDWLYSVGANFEDNGGSSATIYEGKCLAEGELCFDNPTIEIVPNKNYS